MSLIDLIFPRYCLECKKRGQYLCEKCLSKVNEPKSICPICEKSSIDGFVHAKCSRKYGMDGLVSIWDYDGVVRRAIIALKYKYASDIAGELVNHMITNLRKRKVLIPGNCCLAPIPMHWLRENSRGFNQSLDLGEHIAKQLGWKFVPNLLLRIKLNTPQARLSGKERKLNIKGVFSLNPKYNIHNIKIIIFDDVYTTGSTLKEATKELKRKGAKSVWGFTVAR